MTKKLILSAVCAAFMLTACDQIKMTQPEVYDSGDASFYDRPLSVQRANSARQEELRRDSFNVKFKKVADKRRPKALANAVTQDIIYEYDPDKLQGGVRSLVQNHLDNYFGVNSRSEEELTAELDIRNFRTQILTGTLLSGRHGRYHVLIEADVRIRDAMGKVYVLETYEVDYSIPRRTNVGYPPSEKLDKSRMLDAIAVAMQDLGNKISYDVRQSIRNATLVK